MWKKVACYTLLFFSLNAVCKGLTGNFSLSHLTKPAEQESSWDIQEKPTDLDNLLKQKYRYLGRGTQAFVFESEDGKHVLKLFKPLSPKWTLHLFGKAYNIRLSKLPFIQGIFAILHKEETLKQRDLDFQSYINAFSLLREETGLEYLHLTKTSDLKTKLCLFDKIGAVHYLDLDDSCFLLQKRTQMLYPTLASLIKEEKEVDAKEVLDSFVSLAFSLLKNQIVNPTTVEANIGIADKKVLLIDTGRVLRPQDLQIEEPLSLEQIDKTVHHMRKWLKTKSSSLDSYLEKRIEKEKEDFNELEK